MKITGRSGSISCSLPEQLPAVHARHADVGDHHAGEVAIEQGQALGRRVEGPDFEARQLQALAVGRQQILVVVEEGDDARGIEIHAAHTTRRAENGTDTRIPRAGFRSPDIASSLVAL
jgi:hypothetical protein